MQIQEFGINDIVLLLGYKAQLVVNGLGDGQEFGMNIKYDITSASLDTAQRISHAMDYLEDVFLLLYCDNYCPIDYTLLTKSFFDNAADIQLSAYSNNDSYTKSNMYVPAGQDRVKIYDRSKKDLHLNCVDIGYAIVSKACILEIPNEIDNLSDYFPLLIKKGKLFATVTEHRYYSIGSYERMHLTEEFFKDRKVAFIDRDGTLNEKAPKACYIETPEEFRWLDGAKQAVKFLNDAGYTTILITNQPGVARGNLSKEDLAAINTKMQEDLMKIGAHIDYIYVCTHNWDDECDCRKPKPGLLYQAQKDLSLNIPKNCVSFGDASRDELMAKNANCRHCHISSHYPLLSAVKDFLKDSN